MSGSHLPGRLLHPWRQSQGKGAEPDRQSPSAEQQLLRLRGLGPAHLGQDAGRARGKQKVRRAHALDAEQGDPPPR